MKLIINNLSKSYGLNNVLNGINFEFESGKIYGLIGKNGVGKTTFFNCLNGMTQRNCGDVILIKDDNHSQPLSQSDVGFIESTPVLPEFLTGREFIQFLIDIQEDKEKLLIDELFDIVDLNIKDQEKLIKTYSHGMKNKIQILTLFICNAPVLFLDEPLTSLDVVVASDIKKIILKMKKDHIIIFSTHILQLATDLCDELIILNDKKLTLLDHKMLYDKNFETKIIKLLKDDEDD
ncbi:MAG: ABC transporter ATP-binding protein [Clostridia bacterium]|nr:ABC transporter ATP-binding protein [uncultured Schaedlerella sp.]MCI8546429.1 ABC transporter ATP-binding protein [Clostridia bacterium]MCI9128213.1 ABC transporter ATP-binding protein [Eubacterium sp.]